MKKIRYLFLSLLLGIFVVSCGAAPNGGGYIEDGNGGNEIAGDALGDNNIIVPEGHKIIYTVSYDINVKDSLAPTIRTINEEVYTLKGFIYYSDSNLNYAKYIYKVPTENINAFLDAVDELEGVSSKSIQSEDVTSSYNELEAEIETLEASKTAYQNMLLKDNLTLNEIMSLNDKIASIETRLKKLYKDFDSLNSQINYATITISYRLAYVPPQEVFLGDYGNFLLTIGKALIQFIVYTAPFAALAGIGIGVVVIVRKKAKKGESK